MNPMGTSEGHPFPVEIIQSASRSVNPRCRVDYFHNGPRIVMVYDHALYHSRQRGYVIHIFTERLMLQEGNKGQHLDRRHS